MIEQGTTRDIVARTMNLLENEYDVDGLESFGMPTVDEITARIVAAYTKPTRKRTRLEFCDRHRASFLSESVYRRVEVMVEGGWASGGPCGGGRCELYPGLDYICRETCEEYGLAAMPLDWTTEATS
jgi:hypothetical protein